MYPTRQPEAFTARLAPRPRARVWLALALLLAARAPASAWWPEGHAILTRAAIQAVPKSLPAFFRQGAAAAAHASFDPDLAKNRNTPSLRDGESPEHYLDLEYLKGKTLPVTRYAYLRLCARNSLDPSRVGLLPYAVAEWTERLAVAFAEHRRWPNNPHIRAKCLLYAGFLAHYAQDLCQPLHTTIHYDGRVRADGSSPHTGIHTKVDALVERLHLRPAELAAGQRITPAARLMPAITGEITRSRALVDRVYTLDTKVKATGSTWTRAPEAVAFGQERARASVRFTAMLYATAWQQSARVKLPAWLQR